MSKLQFHTSDSIMQLWEKVFSEHLRGIPECLISLDIQFFCFKQTLRLAIIFAGFLQLKKH